MSDLAELLERHRATLVRWFTNHGRYLRRYEAAEDLAQGVHLHAIKHQDRYTHLGEKQFLGWLMQLARQHLADRIAHWKALKRDAGPMLRITMGVDAEADATGPVTHAERREQLHLATLAMDGLPPRDRDLVRLMAAGAEIEDVARQLGMTHAAAQRARLRAVERFRKIVAVIERKRRMRP